MADSTTDFLSFTKPEVGASADSWGDKLNADLDDIDEALRSLVEAGNYAAASGVDTITVSLDPAPATLRTGLQVRFKAAGDNTTAPTLNVNNLGAKAIKFTDGSALAAGDLKSGVIYVVNYDGSAFTTTGVGIATAAEVAGITSNKAITPLAAKYSVSTGIYEQAIGGVCDKWGAASVTSTNGAGTAGAATISFPTAFPASCDSVTATIMLGSGSVSQVSYSTWVSAVSTTGFTLGVSREGSGSDGPFTVYWRATGH